MRTESSFLEQVLVLKKELTKLISELCEQIVICLNVELGGV
jgi:hypothetical protein